MLVFYILLVFCCGFGAPFQTAVNSRLKLHVGSSFVASFVSFVVGLTALSVMVLAKYHVLLLPCNSHTSMPWWCWLGGVVGAVGILINVLLFPKIGGVQTVLMPMLGQIAAGVFIDTFGWFGVPVASLTIVKLLGVSMALLGAFMVVVHKGDSMSFSWQLLPWQLLGILGGILFGMQPTINGVLASAFDSTLYAAFISFLVGSVVLLVCILATRHRHHLPQILVGKAPWWSFMGGLMGVVFVVAFAYFAFKVGPGLLNIVNIFGMLVASVLIDSLGLVGATKISIRPVQYMGLLIILIGIVVLRIA